MARAGIIAPGGSPSSRPSRIPSGCAMPRGGVRILRVVGLDPRMQKAGALVGSRPRRILGFDSISFWMAWRSIAPSHDLFGK